jgi:hypothetical protein
MADKPQMLARMLVGQPTNDAPGPWGMVGAAMPESYGANSPIKDPLANALVSAATLPKRAMDASEKMVRTGEYDAGPFVEAAMLPMGTGAIAGVPMRARESVLGAGPIRAYHGSPHDFDRFRSTRSARARARRLTGMGCILRRMRLG